MAEILINEERNRQKKLSTRKEFGRKIYQRGKNSAEKLINEEFHKKIVSYYKSLFTQFLGMYNFHAAIQFSVKTDHQITYFINQSPFATEVADEIYLPLQELFG